MLRARLLPLVMVMLLQSMILVLEPVAENEVSLDSPSIPTVHWNTEVANPTKAIAGDPSLAIDRNDRPHIAHFDGANDSLQYTTKEGGTWKTEIVDDTDLVGRYPSIAIDSTERMHISYSPQCPSLGIPEDPLPAEPAIKDLRYAFNDGTSWEREYVDNTVWAAISSIALDPLDRPHISYSNWMHSGLYYAKRIHGTWQHTLIDSEGSLESAIAVDSKGNPHIVYSRRADVGKDLYHAEWDGAWHFERIGPGGIILTDLSMARDDLDRLHVIWDTREGLRYGMWNGTWNVENVSDVHPSFLTLTVHKNIPHVYYQSWDHIYGVLQNGSWRWEIVNTTEETGVNWPASRPLAVDSRGVPHLSAAGRVAANVGLVYLSRELVPEGPVADAGPDQTVYEGDVVQFNGSGSYGGGESPLNLTEPIRINNVTTLDQLSMSMAIDSKGHVFIVWTDGRTYDRSDIYLAKSVDGGKSFGENVRVAKVVPYGGRHTSIAHVPDIAVDSQDNIYIVWRNISGKFDNWSVMMSRSFDGGQTFDEKKPVNEPYWAARSIPSVAVGKNDTVYVAWHEKAFDLGGGSRVCVAKSEDRGETFGPCVLANTPSNAASYGTFEMTTVEADPDDRVYASWFSSWGFIGDDIFVSSSQNGGESFGWPPRKVNDGNGSGREVWPVMAVGPEGYVYVAWLDSRNASPDCSYYCDIYFSRSTDNGYTFGPNVRVSNASAEDHFYLPAMALDPYGNLYVSWSSYPRSSIYLDRSMDKGETFGRDVELLRNWSDNFTHMGAMAFSSDGVLHLTFNRRHSEDPWLESRDVYYSRTLASLTAANLTYEWDFDATADVDGNGNFTDDIQGTGPMPTWVYGDNGDFVATLKVTDELGNWDTDTMKVTVLNVLPEVTANYTCTGGGSADLLLRIAGEKWHDVSFIIYEDDNEIYNETVMRVPGNPNEQMIGLEDFELNMYGSYSAVARYTPEDDRVNGQPNGATPAWIILKSSRKEIARLHHTFNVKHPDTWIWRVDDLNSYFPERECIFTAYISDPGSDDLYITWDWGDGTTTEHVYYNDGIGPDPYPSPDVNPISVTDVARHSYASAGTYTISLTVRDDDGGVVTQTLVLDLS